MAFRVYCGFSILLALVIGGVMFNVMIRKGHFSSSSDFLGTLGGLGLIEGLILLALTLHSIGLACPRRPWMHVYGFIVGGLATMSSCAPLGIVLLIFWAKADVSTWFKDEA